MFAYHSAEYALWRQVAQIFFALDHLSHRKPQERPSSLVRTSAGRVLRDEDGAYEHN